MFSCGDWSPGPYGEWSGDCKKLVAVAYSRAGKTLGLGNAWPAFDHCYNRSATPRGAGYPQYGSLVGFRTYMPYGHIAVSIGGNRIASTQGVDFNRKPNAIWTTSTLPSYAVWVVPR